MTLADWQDYLTNAQGEDVVSGTRTPEPIARMAERLGRQLARRTTIYGRADEVAPSASGTALRT